MTENDGIFSMVEETASRLFTRFGAVNDRLYRKSAGAADLNKQAWEEVQAAGLPLAMLDEAHDGVGIEGAFKIARLAGEHALCLPLCETMAANWILVLAGLEAATGPVAFAEDPVHLLQTSDGWKVAGTARAVPWGRNGELVVTAMHEHRLHTMKLHGDELSISRAENLAGEPRDSCTFDCILPADRIALLPSPWGPQSTKLLGAALRAVQIAGAARSTLAMTVNYAGQRRQFGRSIGSFQAVQQLLAVLATHAAAATVSGDIALAGVMNHLNVRSIAVAKTRAGEAAGAIASIAHQVHGAIGFTREHSLHTLTHRLWSWRDEFGSEAFWATRLGHELGAFGGVALWPALTEI